MAMQLYDAHNHLQDRRLLPYFNHISECFTRISLRNAVANGTREEDWHDVVRLSKQDARIIPSIGLHPWYVKERSEKWKENFISLLDAGIAAVGEIGLDRWIEGHDSREQEEVFAFQMKVAAERHLPVTIHCLKAWGRMLEILRSGPVSKAGVLLHSYGGPVEMVEELTRLGAYFSFSGYFAHERKAGNLQVFKRIPLDRILVETDAPDMPPPQFLIEFPMKDETEENPLNHPANLMRIHCFLADFLGLGSEELADIIAKNFCRLFKTGMDEHLVRD